MKCELCDIECDGITVKYAEKHYGRILCYDCQQYCERKNE